MPKDDATLSAASAASAGSVKMRFRNLNDELSPEEVQRLIAETVWMADRPRTWTEWFLWTFCPWTRA
jgi:hypothetical protein